jgi:hypothetical protein
MWRYCLTVWRYEAQLFFAEQSLFDLSVRFFDQGGHSTENVVRKVENRRSVFGAFYSALLLRQRAESGLRWGWHSRC